jgi:hypothetical protein
MVSRELLEPHLHLAWGLSANDWDLTERLTTETASRIVDKGKARHCRKFQLFHEAQHLPLPPNNKETVANLRKVPLEEAAYSALSKSLNFVAAPSFVPVRDIMSRVAKAISVLHEETAEIRQETVRILKRALKPRDNLIGAERRALRALKANEALTVLPTDKDNATVILTPQTTFRRSMPFWRTKPTGS